MQNEYRGALLGAAIGDALGMPNETQPFTRCRIGDGYKKATKYHPNFGVPAGGYTDDTQTALMLGELFVSGNYSPDTYAKQLLKMYTDDTFRFPDGTVLSACRHLASNPEKPPGCNSTTTGCMPLSVIFAMVYKTMDEMQEPLKAACEVTHTNPSAYSAALSFAALVKAAIEGKGDPLKEAERYAAEDTVLYNKIRDARSIASDNIELEFAVRDIGNDVSVHQTLPMACYLIDRFGEEDNFLHIAASVGGNSDTIGYICGAWAGATFGANMLDSDLILGLENYESINTLIDRMWMRFAESSTKN